MPSPSPSTWSPAAVPADVLVGTVRSPELVRATLKIGKESHHRRLGDHVVVGLDDGSERRLIVHEPQVGTKLATRDQWEDLASQPLAQIFHDVAPGDHVKCELDGWRIVPGTRIAFAHDGDEIRVIAVVGRDDATAIDDVRQILRERAARVPRPPSAVVEPPRVPPPRRPWRRAVWFYGALGLVGLAVTAASWVDPRLLLAPDGPPATALVAGVPAVFLVELALLLILSRPWFEVTDTYAPRQRFRPAWSKMGNLALGLMLGFIVTDACGAMPFVSWKPTVFAPIRLYALAGVSLILFILVMHGQRVERRFARLLRFGDILRGTLVADDPPLVRDVRFDQQSRTTGQGDRQRTTFWYEGVATGGGVRPFSLVIDGRRHDVTGTRILWGAPVEYEHVPATEQATVAKTHAQISPGDSVLVRGKPQLDDGVPTFRAIGAESFVMFGAPGNARRALTKLVLRWYAGAALFLIIAVGSVAYGLHLAHLEPLPPVTAERPD